MTAASSVTNSSLILSTSSFGALQAPKAYCVPLKGCAIKQPVARASFKVSDPISSVLNGFRKSIEKLLEDVANEVHSTGLDLILKAGEEAIRVIESLKGAYNDSLDKTVEKVDALVRDNLDRVRNLVNDIINREQDALETVSDRIEDIVKFSPLSNWWIPLLKDTQPRFFAVDSDPNDDTRVFSTKVMVVFKGNFAYADQPDCIPSFTVGNKTYQPVVHSTKELQFLIEVSNATPKVKMHKFAYLQGELRVDWKTSWTPWSWTVSKYTMLLGILPASPGKVTFLLTKTEKSLSRRVCYDSPEVWHQGKDKWVTSLVVVPPDRGWHVVRGSSAFHWISSHGETMRAFQSDDNDQVIWQYGLRKKAYGKFQIFFEESQTVPESDRQEVIDDLRWGGSRVFSPKQGERIRKIVFEAFNGESFEFQPMTDTSNPLIELREFNGTFQIKAKKASKINEPDIRSLTETIHNKKMDDLARESSTGAPKRLIRETNLLTL